AVDGALDARRGEAFRVIDELEIEPTVIAHPALVHGIVVTRRLPVDDAFARPEHGVAAGRAVWADRLRLFQEPNALLETEIVRRKRADRADVDDVEIIVGLWLLAGVAGQRRVTATVDEAETILPGHFLHEAHATRAEDATLVIKHDFLA